MLRVRCLIIVIAGWLCLTACTSPSPPQVTQPTASPPPKVTQPTASPQPLPTFTSNVADSAWQVWHVSSLPKAIYSLALQGDRLWVGTEYGLWQLDPETNRIARYDDQLGTVHLLLPIENGQAWASASKGLFFFDGQAWHRVQLTNESPPRGYTACTAIAVDAAGNLWLEFSDYRGSKYSARYRGHVPAADVMAFDSAGYYGLTVGTIDCDQWPAAARTYGQFHRSAAECRTLQSVGKTLPPARYPSTQLAFDTDGSIWRADLYDGSISHWVNGISTTVGLPAGTRIDALAPDPTQGVWIGTDQGLAHAAATELRWLPDLDQHFTLGRPIDLSVEPSGNVWVLTAESALNWLPADRSSTQFKAIANVGARAMAAAADSLWITHGTDLIRIKLGDPPSASAPPPVMDDCNLDRLTVDRVGDVWSTTRCGVAWQYQPATHHWIRHALTKPAPFAAELDPIQHIVVSADGTVYAVGLSGLGELTAAGDVITATAAPTATALPYPTDRHRALFLSGDSSVNRPGILTESRSAADRQGGIWLAIIDQPELWHYTNGQVSTLAHPLNSRWVSQLQVDQRGWLWEVGNDQQLAVYDGQAWRTVATPDLGTIKRIADDRDGGLWFMGDRGIAMYDPAKDKQP